MSAPISDFWKKTSESKIPKTYAGLLNLEQTDYLDLLGDLYEKWESTQFPINQAREELGCAWFCIILFAALCLCVVAAILTLFLRP